MDPRLLLAFGIVLTVALLARWAYSRTRAGRTRAPIELTPARGHLRPPVLAGEGFFESGTEGD